jgi:hypothetical protein
MIYVLLIVVVILLIWVIYNQFGIAENQVLIVKKIEDSKGLDDKLRVRIDDMLGSKGV